MNWKKSLTLPLVLFASLVAASQTTYNNGPTAYTPNLNLGQPPLHMLNWGNVENSNMSILDSLLGGQSQLPTAFWANNVGSTGRYGAVMLQAGPTNTTAANASLVGSAYGIAPTGADSRVPYANLPAPVAYLNTLTTPCGDGTHALSFNGAGFNCQTLSGGGGGGGTGTPNAFAVYTGPNGAQGSSSLMTYAYSGGATGYTTLSFSGSTADNQDLGLLGYPAGNILFIDTPTGGNDTFRHGSTSAQDQVFSGTQESFGLPMDVHGNVYEGASPAGVYLGSAPAYCESFTCRTLNAAQLILDQWHLDSSAANQHNSRIFTNGNLWQFEEMSDDWNTEFPVFRVTNTSTGSALGASFSVLVPATLSSTLAVAGGGSFGGPLGITGDLNHDCTEAEFRSENMGSCEVGSYESTASGYDRQVGDEAGPTGFQNFVNYGGIGIRGGDALVANFTGRAGDLNVRVLNLNFSGSTITAANEGVDIYRDQWFELPPVAGIIAGPNAVYNTTGGTGGTPNFDDDVLLYVYGSSMITAGVGSPVLDFTQGPISLVVDNVVSGNTVHTTNTLTPASSGTLASTGVSVANGNPIGAGTYTTVGLTMNAPLAANTECAYPGGASEAPEIFNILAVTGTQPNYNITYRARENHPGNVVVNCGGIVGRFYTTEANPVPHAATFVHPQMIVNNTASTVTVGYRNFSGAGSGYLSTGTHMVYQGALLVSVADPTQGNARTGNLVVAGSNVPWSNNDQVVQNANPNESISGHHTLLQVYNPTAIFTDEEMDVQEFDPDTGWGRRWNFPGSGVTWNYSQGGNRGLFSADAPPNGMYTQNSVNGVRALLGIGETAPTDNYFIFATGYSAGGFNGIMVNGASQRYGMPGTDYERFLTIGEDAQVDCGVGFEAQVTCGQFGTAYVISGPTPIAGGFSVYEGTISAANYYGGLRYLRAAEMASGGADLNPSPDAALHDTWVLDTTGRGLRVVNQTGTDTKTAWAFTPAGNLVLGYGHVIIPDSSGNEWQLNVDTSGNLTVTAAGTLARRRPATLRRRRKAVR